MEDSLIKIQAVFVDSSTGEIIAQSSFERTIFLLKHEDVTRYVDSFLRGLRQNKSVALNLTLYRSKDVGAIVEPFLFENDVY